MPADPLLPNPIEDDDARSETECYLFTGLASLRTSLGLDPDLAGTAPDPGPSRQAF